VAVERTNFVLIEKSPAPNPIYKPANMAGVGRSLARSLASASPRLTAPLANPDTHKGGRDFESAMHHVSGIRDLKVGELSATTWPRKKNEEPGRNAGRLPSYEVSALD